MNKEYVCFDQNVVIKTEDGNQILTDYCNNIGEILEKENLIETMEKEVSELKKEITEKEENIKGLKQSIFAIPFTVPITLAAAFLMFWLLGGDISAMFNGCPILVLVATVCLTVVTFFVGTLEISSYLEYKADLRDVKGMNSVFEYLKENIKKEKEGLERLNQQKETTKNDKPFRIEEINNIEMLKQLKQNLDLYYGCGYNEDKLIKYHQNGNLRHKLEKKFNEAQLQIIEEYVEDKGPSLTKKRKNNK